jgi:hypothetical protein
MAVLRAERHQILQDVCSRDMPMDGERVLIGSRKQRLDSRIRRAISARLDDGACYSTR